MRLCWIVNFPQNYVIATGETHSIREFVELAFRAIGIEIEWVGQGKMKLE